MPARPSVVVFDVVETLMSSDPLRARLTDEGASGDLLPRWFDRIVRDGMAPTVAGDYRPFPEVAASVLRSVAPHLSGDAVRRVLDGFADLPAHPDAEPAMRALTDAGVSVVCLSNGPALSTVRFLLRSGLDRYVGDVLSAEDAGRWKPAREVYQHALRHIGRPAPGLGVWIVACQQAFWRRSQSLQLCQRSLAQRRWLFACALPDAADRLEQQRRTGAERVDEDRGD